MKRTSLIVALFFAFMAAWTLPGLTQDRGHGAIYYSASGSRIGWSKSLGSDGDADQAAAAMCRGGQIQAVYLQEFQNQQAGVSATGAGPQIGVAETDCRKIIKFDSADNHQCAGFGFDANGNVSGGVRKSDRSSVESSLSSWSQTFVICNDDRSVSGVQQFANALGQLAAALGGSNRSNQTNQTNQINSTTVVFHNVTNSTATVGLKCTDESSYHSFTVSAGGTQSIDGSSWGEGCGTYDFLVTTPAADGSSTSVTHQVQGGRSYNVVFNQQKNAFDLGGAGGGGNLVVVNDTNADITYLVMCPSLNPTKRTVAAGASNSTHLNCNTATLQVATGSSTDATYKSFPVQNGKTYHLRFDANAQDIVIVPEP
jgi:hypothetical protein